MKASELRIGNAIRYGQTITKVTIDDLRDMLELERKNSANTPYSEIELTQEIVDSVTDKSIKFERMAETTNTFFFILDHPPINFFTTIKTAHKLQNIYFALFGIEITFVL